MEVSRRDFVKICGAGAAVAGLSSVLPAHALGLLLRLPARPELPPQPARPQPAWRRC